MTLKQGGKIQTQTLAATQRRRGAGQADGSGGASSKCGYSAGGAARGTKLRRGGMKAYSPGSTSTFPAKKPARQRGGGFCVAGSHVCCRVVSYAACVLSSDTSTLPPTSTSCRLLVQCVLYLVPKIVLYHNKTTAVPYIPTAVVYLLSEHHRSPLSRSLRLPVPYALHKSICARTVYYSSS